jgi:hypothetical protein
MNKSKNDRFRTKNDTQKSLSFFVFDGNCHSKQQSRSKTTDLGENNYFVVLAESYTTTIFQG